MEHPDILEKLQIYKKNDTKTIPRLLKRLKKIESVSQYEEYKSNLLISLTDWCFETLIMRPFIIFMCITCLLIGHNSLVPLVIQSEGISILWFLLIELKLDLWRKNGKS